MYYYVYILQSEKDKFFYVGYTSDLKNRIELHNNGKVSSTKNRVPLKLVYFEACLNQQDATHREKYLKTSWGKRYIKIRLKNYLTGWSEAELIFTALAELSSRQIAETEQAQGIPENAAAGKKGGKIAKDARIALEKKTGKKVVTGENFLPPAKQKKKLKNWQTQNFQLFNFRLNSISFAFCHHNFVF